MSSLTITIEAGPHERRSCPVEFTTPEGLQAGTWDLVARDERRLKLEVDADGTARCVVPFMEAGHEYCFGIEPEREVSNSHGIAVCDSGSAVDIAIDGELLTRYVYKEVHARPYFYPVMAPGQVPVTRSFPMEPGAPGETRDHSHHRSMWIAHGEVNDADNWSESPGHAHTRHEEFEHVSSGRLSGGFSSHSSWIGSGGATLLTQRLRVRAWSSGGDARLVDLDIVLEASHGDVKFGDTKEGGILSIRVASEMDVPRTGRITNVYGGLDEAETWGKAAHWCDYSGIVAGSPVGIAVFDHPRSFRHPTHWHVRNYGLMTANPFGYSAYTGGEKDGSHYLKSGERLAFRYRVLLHRHDCSTARVGERYLDFVSPPKVSITS